MAFTPQFNFGTLRGLDATLEAAGIERPRVIARAFAIGELLERQSSPTVPDLLDLDDQGIADAIQGEALAAAAGVGGLGNAMHQAQARLHEAVAFQVAEQLRAGASDEIVLALRPRFDALAATILQAVELGISPRTTAQDVLNAGNVKMTDAWQKLPKALDEIGRIASVRIELARALGDTPTADELSRAADQLRYDSPTHNDYTVLFAAGAGWSTFGELNAGGRPDWLTIASRGGLRLNTGAEARAKLARRAAGLPPRGPSYVTREAGEK